jgi:hypothetical protein
MVRRNLFMAVDRHQLSYLNAIEKLHCFFCGYASGLIAYSREIIACTEQYWCPIKHARKIIDPHRRYARFADFGEAEGYQEHFLTMRNRVREQDKRGKRCQVYLFQSKNRPGTFIDTCVFTSGTRCFLVRCSVNSLSAYVPRPSSSIFNAMSSSTSFRAMTPTSLPLSTTM